MDKDVQGVQQYNQIILVKGKVGCKQSHHFRKSHKSHIILSKYRSTMVARIFFYHCVASTNIILVSNLCVIKTIDFILTSVTIATTFLMQK